MSQDPTDLNTASLQPSALSPQPFPIPRPPRHPLRTRNGRLRATTLCRRYQGRQERPHLQRPLLPHQGSAPQHHPLHPPLHRAGRPRFGRVLRLRYDRRSRADVRPAPCRPAELIPRTQRPRWPARLHSQRPIARRHPHRISTTSSAPTLPPWASANSPYQSGNYSSFPD